MKQVTRTPIKIDEKYKRLVDTRAFYEQEKTRSKCFGVACSSVDVKCRSECEVLAECKEKCDRLPPVHLTSIEFRDLMEVLERQATKANKAAQRDPMSAHILREINAIMQMLSTAQARTRREIG